MLRVFIQPLGKREKSSLLWGSFKLDTDFEGPDRLLPRIAQTDWLKQTENKHVCSLFGHWQAGEIPSFKVRQLIAIESKFENEHSFRLYARHQDEQRWKQLLQHDESSQRKTLLSKLEMRILA